MFPLPAGIVVGFKWLAALGIVSIGAYGIHWLWNQHLTAIDNAVNQVKVEAAINEGRKVREITEQLKAEQEAQRIALQAELERARATSNSLRRMLTIEHDLDRLLQRKPGLILPRVNEGTKEAIERLEELTQ